VVWRQNGSAAREARVRVWQGECAECSVRQQRRGAAATRAVRVRTEMAQPGRGRSCPIAEDARRRLRR